MTTATAPFAGTYAADPVHSSFGFAVRYQGVSLFRGTLDEVDATLTDGRLEGAAKVESISIRTPEQFRAHVLGAEFFDAANHPEVTLRLHRRSTSRDDGTADVDGELTIKGITRPVTRHRHLDRAGRRRLRQHPRPPQPRGRRRPHRVRHELEHAAALRRQRARQRRHADRRALAGRAGASPMRILGIAGSLRRGSHNRRLLRAAGNALPPGAELVEWDGLGGLPIFDEDLEDSPPAAGAGVPRRDRRRRRAPDRHARVQRLAARRAQERARLGLPAVPRQRAARQAERGDRRRAPACSARSGRRPRCARRSRPAARTCSSPSCRSAWPTAPSPTTARSPTPSSARGWATCWATSCARWRARRAGGMIAARGRAPRSLGPDAPTRERADAARNRRRILEAAAALVARARHRARLDGGRRPRGRASAPARCTAASATAPASRSRCSTSRRARSRTR